MERFKSYLHQIYIEKSKKNPRYSLRAFAKTLNINHATLSGIMSGKRKITEFTIQKLATKLDLAPSEIKTFFNSTSKAKKALEFESLKQDTFNAIAEWYYDAILEYTQIKSFKFDPHTIATYLGISVLKSKIAIETLERLELLKFEKGYYKLTTPHTTNILDSESTSVAQKRYQKSILEKSLLALDEVSISERDHTSVTLAIKKSDLKNAKALIKKFRSDITQYLQREYVSPDEVYQLQVSLFPLANIGGR